MHEIIQFARDNGYNLSEIVPDGKIHRFPVALDDHRNSGWYLGHQNHIVKSGQVFYVVMFGNYRTRETITYSDGSIKISREDRKIMDAQMAKARAEAEALRLIHQKETAIDVENTWNTFLSSGDSDYLNRKLIYDCPNMGIKFNEEGIYIPARDINGKIWSMQKVSHDGAKKFFPGGKILGNYHVIGDINSSDKIRLCEDFATGASVSMATGAPVVITFTSGNMPGIAKQLKELYPEKVFIICGDEDKFKVDIKTGLIPNPGRVVAEEVAKTVLGKAIFPVFKDESTKPTDWNDLHLLEGIDEVKNQLINIIVPKLALHALGFKEGEYFFTSSDNRQIVALSAFTEKDFYHLMPQRFWEANYPGRSDNNKIDWGIAKSDLMEQCRKRGLFDGFNVRGAGVWMDAGRIVVNMGDHLIVDGEKVTLGDIKSKFFYSLGMNLAQLHSEPLSVSDCTPLVHACQGFKWAKKDSGILLAGALVLSRVCGAIPVRPHVWVTGGAETGKTTLLEKLISKVIGQNALYVSRGTTEAGVRQSLKSNSVPVLFDEFETTNTMGDNTIDSLIELMRGAWSDSRAKIIKGGASGNASQYEARFSAIVSSIRTKLTNDADRGRFTVVELLPHGADQDHWNKLKVNLLKIDQDFSDRLFARTIQMLPIILANFEVMQAALAKRSGSRFGDQYGMILAGYASLIYDDKLTSEEAEWLADEVELSEEKENTKNSDHEDAFNHLLTTKIVYESGTVKIEALVGDVIQSILRKPELHEVEKKTLLNLGIRVESTYVGIVASGHAELENKIYRGTKWAKNWGVSLKRLTGSDKKKIRIMAGRTTWAITVPISHFNDQQAIFS